MNPIKTFKLFGLDKSQLVTFLTENGVKHEIISNSNDILLKINYDGLSDTFIDRFQKEFLSKFSMYIYAETDISLENQLVKILTVRGAKLSVAESFTGGGLSSRITSVSGASKVFYEGIVAYSPDAKHDRLGVSYQILDTFKPVSSQVASEMCKGLLERGCDIAISTTGIAGPKSDDSDFPVGLCYTGVSSKSKITVFKHKFKGTREDITKSGIEVALFHAIMALRSGSFDV
ncbi:MAG: CinA family protein [Clostridia bacterium]|nr:CinA family protein [Clostridia bacterium]